MNCIFSYALVFNNGQAAGGITQNMKNLIISFSLETSLTPQNAPTFL
jgi:hypothetical protein